MTPTTPSAFIRLSLALCAICLLLPLETAANGSAKSLTLSNFEAPLEAQWQASANDPDRSPFTLESNPQKIREGSGSARWQPIRRPWAVLKNVPQDWSAYDALSLWVYAEKDNGQLINIWAYSTKAGAERQGYYFHQITVDWTGWKQVLIPLKSFRAVHAPAGWNQINNLMFSARGMDVQPLEDTTLWLDSLTLEAL